MRLNTWRVRVGLSVLSAIISDTGEGKKKNFWVRIPSEWKRKGRYFILYFIVIVLFLYLFFYLFNYSFHFRYISILFTVVCLRISLTYLFSLTFRLVFHGLKNEYKQKQKRNVDTMNFLLRPKNTNHIFQLISYYQLYLSTIISM